MRPVEDSRALFESEALANRALHHARTFSARLRSLVTRSYASVRSADPPGVSSNEIRDGGQDRDGHVPDRGLDWNRLNASAVESLEALVVLVEFGAVRPPWVKEFTGSLGHASTLAQAAAFLREHPAAVAFFQWYDQEAPLEAMLLHWVVGEVLPLPRAEKMEYLRERLRGIRAIWVVTNPASIPSNDLRAAADQLLSFAAMLSSVKAIDPSLALLAGTDEESDVRHRMPKLVDNDFTLIRRALDEAVDIAVWEGETETAGRLLKEAGRFSECQIQAVVEPAEKATYRRLAMQADEIAEELIRASNDFSASARQHVWRRSNSRAHGLLKSAVEDGVTITVPGADVGVRRPEGNLDVVATVASPDDPDVDLAPWLYGIDLSVLPMRSDSDDQAATVSGLPIALVDLATGARHIRRLVHDESEIPDDGLRTAHFRNLTPGTYRVEVVPWGSGPAREHRVPPSDRLDSSGGASRRPHSWTLARQIWQRISSLLERLYVRRFAAAALRSAA